MEVFLELISPSVVSPQQRLFMFRCLPPGPNQQLVLDAFKNGAPQLGGDAKKQKPKKKKEIDSSDDKESEEGEDSDSSETVFWDSLSHLVYIYFSNVYYFFNSLSMSSVSFITALLFLNSNVFLYGF